jgi:putative endonuclease
VHSGAEQRPRGGNASRGRGRSPASRGAGRGDGRREVGRSGERFAAAHLESIGFRVLSRNARTRRGEIDLIAFDGVTLAFVEVKTRRGRARKRGSDPQPLLGLGGRQRARLRQLAAAWLTQSARERPYARTIRFDAIGVLVGTRGELLHLEHLEAAW